ncbi:unnamed protein product [Amoebophrya sp. A25]|nr:unnamed protein product [Amoebophrya sp. A25]|eukprot:GSA25T00023579001.1
MALLVETAKMADGVARVAVSCRMRPALDADMKLAKWELTDTTIALPSQKRIDIWGAVADPGGDRVTETHMDHVYDSGVSTNNVYQSSFRPIVEKAVQGLNGCIMAYGQTSSGKTYSMLGGYAGGGTSSGSSSATSAASGSGGGGSSSSTGHGHKMNKGIIQLACEDAFYMMDDLRSKSGMKHRVRFSLCEVYMERVSDLLAASHQLKPQYLSVKECPSSYNNAAPTSTTHLPHHLTTAAPSGALSSVSNSTFQSVPACAEFYVEHLSEHDAFDASDIMEKLAFAERKRRKVAQTKYNEVSSRSHTVLTVTIEATATPQSSEVEGNKMEEEDNQNESKTSSAIAGKKHVQVKMNEDAVATTQVGKLVFVDLAGNERLDETMQYLQEGSAINLSLFFLGECISKLSNMSTKSSSTDPVNANPLVHQGGAGNEGYIPYRDSKLTRILAVHLGQNSHTGILVCLHPGEKFIEQSVCSLRFAQKASQVVSRIRPVYRSKGEELVQRLRARVRFLEAELEDARTADSGGRQVEDGASAGTSNGDGAGGKQVVLSGSRETDRIVLALNQANSKYKALLTKYRSFLSTFEVEIEKRELESADVEGEGGDGTEEDGEEILGSERNQLDRIPRGTEASSPGFGDLSAINRVLGRFTKYADRMSRSLAQAQSAHRLAQVAAEKLQLSEGTSRASDGSLILGTEQVTPSKRSLLAAEEAGGGTFLRTFESGNVTLSTLGGNAGAFSSTKNLLSAESQMRILAGRVADLERQLKMERENNILGSTLHSQTSSPSKCSQTSTSHFASSALQSNAGVSMLNKFQTVAGGGFGSTPGKMSSVSTSSTITQQAPPSATMTSHLLGTGHPPGGQQHVQELKAQNSQLKTINKYLASEKMRWKGEAERAKVETQEKVTTLEDRVASLMADIAKAERAGRNSSTAAAGQKVSEGTRVSTPTSRRGDGDDIIAPNFFSGRVQALLERSERSAASLAYRGESDEKSGTRLQLQTEDESGRVLEQHALSSQQQKQRSGRGGSSSSHYPDVDQFLAREDENAELAVKVTTLNIELGKQQDEIAVLRLERDEMEADFDKERRDNAGLREKLGSVMAARRDADRNLNALQTTLQKRVEDVEVENKQLKKELQDSRWARNSLINVSTTGGAGAVTDNSKASGSSSSTSAGQLSLGGTSGESKGVVSASFTPAMQDSLQKKNADLIQKVEKLEASEKKLTELLATLQRRTETAQGDMKRKDQEVTRMRDEVNEMRKALLLARKNASSSAAGAGAISTHGAGHGMGLRDPRPLPLSSSGGGSQSSVKPPYYSQAVASAGAPLGTGNASSQGNSRRSSSVFSELASDMIAGSAHRTPTARQAAQTRPPADVSPPLVPLQNINYLYEGGRDDRLPPGGIGVSLQASLPGGGYNPGPLSTRHATSTKGPAGSLAASCRGKSTGTIATNTSSTGAPSGVVRASLMALPSPSVAGACMLAEESVRNIKRSYNVG